MIQGTDGNFYGTTAGGGAFGAGAVFKVTPAGVESILYSFAGGGANGATPQSLIQEQRRWLPQHGATCPGRLRPVLAGVWNHFSSSPRPGF